MTSRRSQARRPGVVVCRSGWALTAAGGMAIAGGPATAQLGEPFPADFWLESIAGPGGEGLGVALRGSGWAVAAAGDVNGDGVADAIVGSPGAVWPGRGESYVVFGRTAAGPPFPQRISLQQLDESDGFLAFSTGWEHTGWSVASAGDMNGDGFDDVVIGAPYADPQGREHAGRSYVVFGGEDLPAIIELSDLDGERGFALDGDSRFNLTGWTVAGAGDLNGDGIDDLVVGAPRPYYFTCPYYCYSPAREGRAYVIFGRDTRAGTRFPASVDLRDLDGVTGFRLDGAVGDHAGFAVAPVGDVNGDGLDDVVVTAPYGGPYGRGHAYIVFGRDSISVFPPVVKLLELEGVTGFRIEGTSSLTLGVAASAGDVNGDGRPDVIIGAYSGGPSGLSSAGSSFVIFGRGGASGTGFPSVLSVEELDGVTGFRLEGVDSGDHSGFAVASGGDINADGVDDVVIGAPGVSWLHHYQAGTAYVIFGRNAGVGQSFPAELKLAELDGISGFRFRGDEPDDRAGRSVAIVGDVNDDGVDDLFIGARESSYIIFGRMPDAPCYADCDASGGLDFFDFLCFQNLFAAGDPQADCDGSGGLDFFDFLCFQNAFAAGCP